MGSLAVAPIIGAGVLARWMHSVWDAPLAVRSEATPSFSSVPLKLGPWIGADLPMDRRVLQTARNDAYLHRRYVHENSGQFVYVYLAFTMTPSHMLGHRPRECYPANGWTHMTTQTTEAALEGDRRLPCLVHEFAQYQPVYQGLVVVNYYVLDGRTTNDWTEFWGPRWRVARASIGPMRYVAQIQVGRTFTDRSNRSRAEEQVRDFVCLLAPEIDRLLPRQNADSGEVRSAQVRPGEKDSDERDSPRQVGAMQGTAG
ncbi:MAG: exosortase-associated EpsI family protein [Phycisphaerae bacterium]|nr:exosortase-associated EpsI family protein [Phycisphaerae bacterium]